MPTSPEARDAALELAERLYRMSASWRGEGDELRVRLRDEAVALVAAGGRREAQRILDRIAALLQLALRLRVAAAVDLAAAFARVLDLRALIRDDGRLRDAGRGYDAAAAA